MSLRRLSLFSLLAILLSATGHAQQSPFLPEDTYRKLVNEISGEVAHEHMRFFTQHHRPMGGSEGFEAVAEYVRKKAIEVGLEDVRYIKLGTETRSWNGKSAELWLIAPEERRLAFHGEIKIALADYSRSAEVKSAELIDVGEGTDDADFEGKAVGGKVVLASGALTKVMEEAVWKRGALGIVYFTTARTAMPDQIPWVRIPIENADKSKQGTWAFVLSQREGTRLRKQLTRRTPRSADASKKSSVTRPMLVRLKIDSEFLEQSSQAIVEGVIRGTSIHDQDLVLTGHLQEELFSANDDASGCANVLEIARTLVKLINEGKLPRPQRDIRFWWADEISAEERYFSDFPDERQQFLANVNQDMVGAKQSLGDRVQFVTRPPSSRASFLGDVVESVVEALVHGNTAYLAAGQARQLTRGEAGTAAISDEDSPFGRPIYSRIGTREHYDARVIPFHNNTDHQVFNMGIIGIPAVTFTNWPDDFIHSTDDDLWQMDRTQLKRNAVAVAGITWFLATAGANELPTLLTEMYGRGNERISRDMATAMRMLQQAAPAARSAAWARASVLVRESVRRELRAIDTAKRISGSVAGSALMQASAGQPMSAEEAEKRLSGYYAALTGASPAPMVRSKKETELAAKVPARVDSVKDFMAGRKKAVKPGSLHSLMAYEVLNFADGQRSYLDIFEAVSAEADSAGEWYYGRVTLEDVASYLDSAEKAGMLKIR